MEYTGPALGKLKKYFFLSYYIQFQPYIWAQNREAAAIGVTSKLSRLTLWYFNVTLSFAYFFFILIRIIQVHLDPNSSLLQSIFMQLMSLLYLGVNMAHLTNLTGRSDVAEFIRNQIRLAEGAYDGNCVKYSPRVQWSS